jgi:hypothetical protein
MPESIYQIYNLYIYHVFYFAKLDYNEVQVSISIKKLDSSKYFISLEFIFGNKVKSLTKFLVEITILINHDFIRGYCY